MAKTTLASKHATRNSTAAHRLPRRPIGDLLISAIANSASMSARDEEQIGREFSATTLALSKAEVVRFIAAHVDHAQSDKVAMRHIESVSIAISQFQAAPASTLYRALLSEFRGLCVHLTPNADVLLDFARLIPAQEAAVRHAARMIWLQKKTPGAVAEINARYGR